MKNLKCLRKENNIKQETVASALNIARSTYQSYEYGVAEPDFETLKKLADYFHTTTDFLLEHEVPYLINKSEFSKEQIVLFEKIKKLDKETCNKLNFYIDGLNDGKK